MSLVMPRSWCCWIAGSSGDVVRERAGELRVWGYRTLLRYLPPIMEAVARGEAHAAVYGNMEAAGADGR